MYTRLSLPSRTHKLFKPSVLYLCDLNTPVEQPLPAKLVLVVPDVLQQRAWTAELGDELQAFTRTYTQDPDNVAVVQASHCHHVLWP